MFRFAVLASCVALAPACRISLESPDPIVEIDAPVSPVCMDATLHSDLKWIEENVFKGSCIFSGCHNGANNREGKLDLRPDGTPGIGGIPAATGGPGRTAQFLVNVASEIDMTYKRVVPNEPNQSYLMMMIQHIKPTELTPPAADTLPISQDGKPVPLMPQNTGGRKLCVEKRDAIQRWIVAGAPAR
jgi:hypothetical protein